ncbi:unnamed protein product [Rhizoctonia solani]|uniref:Saccharopine dehydrogenase NADP binding domain-containing protein n=1 Tax=Rhizoctonia solani TaxID=456999 RepID=A0A8H2W7H9_9AGAM|nr:unnamed protein product [Rhizoctonia solani]
MSEREFDILVIGATGYTGQLIIEYLANHSRAPSLRIALGGRTISKVQELANKYNNVAAIYVDVSKEPSVEEAVAKTRVVINIAGPYWTRGACAKNSVHYVDLTGEAPWVAQIIEEYDYLAHKNKACIVPCSGYDSIPSDLAAHLALRALEKQLGGKLPSHISSTAAHKTKGGISGGTAASIMSAFEEVPREQRAKGLGWGLSPMPAPPGFSALPRMLYSLPHITPTIWGGYFVMSAINASIVRRSWGLRYYQAPKSKCPTFSYTEFMTINGSLISGLLISLTVFFFGAAMALLPPVRWLVKNVLPKSGEGPSPDKLDKGYFGVVNVAEGGGVVVKAIVDGNGDPGYRLTSIMIVESALLLLDPENLTDIGKGGGILTPSVAYGDALAKVLEGTGRFKIGVEVLEDKKTRDMSERLFDILVIGATGYTGRLVVEYLANHSRAHSLRIALGGRTISKVQELANKYKNVGALYVDVGEEQSVKEAVPKARVVMNIAGPYWERGSVVVKACAENGVHYVDLAGEVHWVSDMIEQYDQLAHKNKACIVPSSGYDSIPSDLAAHLALRELEKELAGNLPSHIRSTAAHTFKGGMSGGTATTVLSSFDLPSDQRLKGAGWTLSPIPAPPGFSLLPKILYSLPHIKPKVWGGFFIMSAVNEPVVRRSWGLRQQQVPPSDRPIFSYNEFMSTKGGPIMGILLSFTLFFTIAALTILPPFRWLLKRMSPKSGEGPSPDKLEGGYFGVINVTEAGDIAVKATIDGKGDPSYTLTAIMIAESALLLLDPENLTDVGKQGGLLTPSVAYGDALEKVLERTGRFKIGVEVLDTKDKQRE